MAVNVNGIKISYGMPAAAVLPLDRVPGGQVPRMASQPSVTSSSPAGLVILAYLRNAPGGERGSRAAQKRGPAPGAQGGPAGPVCERGRVPGGRQEGPPVHVADEEGPVGTRRAPGCGHRPAGRAGAWYPRASGRRERVQLWTAI